MCGKLFRYFVRFSIPSIIVLFQIIEVARAETLMVARVENIPDQLVGSAIAEVAFAKIGFELQFHDFPAKRALLTSTSGELDAELQRVYAVGDRHKTLIRVPTPYTYMDAVAFGIKPNAEIDGWDSLKPHIVARARGILFAEIGLQGHDQVIVVANSEDVFKAIALGRAEIGISTMQYGKTASDKLGIKVFPLGPVLERIPLYFYLHEKHAHLVNQIDAVFREMKASGELEALRRAHFERIQLQAPPTEPDS